MVEPLTLNQTEAAALLGVTTRTLYNMRMEGLIQPLPQFKSIRFSAEDVKSLAKQIEPQKAG